MSAPLASRRDAAVICAGCRRQVRRQSRQQRFCSDRCRNREIGRRRVKKARLGLDTGRPANPPKKDNKLKALQRAELLSSHHIFGPPGVLAVEVSDRSWQPAISSSGVLIEIGRLRARKQLPKKIWEPAVGRGAIARVLEAAGHEVVGTDLIDYGAGFVGEIDFLKEHTARADCIVTNPPFMYGNEFVAHALELAPTVIMLLRLAFFESDRRTGILEGRGLRRIHVFRKRLPMMHRASWQGRKANSGMAFAWFRWDRGYAGPTTIRRISWKAPSGRTNLDTSAMAAEPSVTLSRATADSDCLQLIQRRDFHEAQTTD